MICSHGPDWLAAVMADGAVTSQELCSLLVRDRSVWNECRLVHDPKLPCFWDLDCCSVRKGRIYQATGVSSVYLSLAILQHGQMLIPGSDSNSAPSPLLVVPHKHICNRYCAIISCNNDHGCRAESAMERLWSLSINRVSKMTCAEGIVNNDWRINVATSYTHRAAESLEDGYVADNGA